METLNFYQRLIIKLRLATITPFIEKDEKQLNLLTEIREELENTYTDKNHNFKRNGYVEFD